MCSGVLLLSGGKTIFSGPRSELPKHMGSLGYPCPPFKNPADYYRKLKRNLFILCIQKYHRI
jgi:hypothetical protein